MCILKQKCDEGAKVTYKCSGLYLEPLIVQQWNAALFLDVTRINVLRNTTTRASHLINGSMVACGDTILFWTTVAMGGECM